MKDSNTATDSDDSNVDEGESRSSVGEKHFIHATPYHKNGLYMNKLPKKLVIEIYSNFD